MTSADLDSGARRPEPEPSGSSCADCDPKLLDRLTCRAQGTKAKADYDAQTMGPLSEARALFEKAGPDYAHARETAVPVVQDLRHQLEHLIDQLTCLVDDHDAIGLLRRAFRHVEAELDECGGDSGCYFEDDCDFGDVRDCDADDIDARIADITRRAAVAKAAFDDLVTEPVALPQRLAAVQKEVETIKTRMAGDPRTTDFKRLYVDALVARRHLAAVWRGFRHSNAYVDCLCRALTGQIKAQAAIASLRGRKAVHQCHLDAEQAQCERLRTHTADAVIAEFIRLGHDGPRYDDGDDSGDDGGQSYDRRGEEGSRREEEGDRREEDNRYRERERERDRDRYGFSARDR